MHNTIETLRGDRTMAGSIRHNFHQSLESLQQEILRMGSIVEQVIAKAVESLAKLDSKIANEVIEGDTVVDELELQIEDQCLKLIATQQPMAKDLRKIAAGFKIITDLERIADYSVDIARTANRIIATGQPLIKPLIDIPRMAELAQNMVKQALDAYVHGDVKLAYAVAEADDQVDQLHNQIFRELLVFMMENPRTITQATYLLFVSRYLERIADHATNIAEEAIYLETGERKELND
ncbi:MAG: phosphate signaling complex protein PhoU [Thermanaeromonas sp.]|uniref:phosphate signaling complex protein PhoU n=1 Tax=Thermanaeromonas sp. TaxID=2003697 RepID=UPI0024408DD1|nr:phosphate signaling complex protein PhoU [Thermanaeromonas sp.]MCG0277670.1 phosphate signaling complex protein PhoU [Thermanaeromonas sp.]